MSLLLCVCGAEMDEPSKNLCSVCYHFWRAVSEARRNIQYQRRYQPDISKRAAAELVVLISFFNRSVDLCEESERRSWMPIQVRFVELRMLSRVADRRNSHKSHPNERRVAKFEKELFCERGKTSFHNLRTSCYRQRNELKERIRQAN